jgi:uncharacterized protein (DUF1810 family)
MFPQLIGKGWSEMSKEWTLRGLRDGKAYFSNDERNKQFSEGIKVIAQSRQDKAFHGEALWGLDAVKFQACVITFFPVA